LPNNQPRIQPGPSKERLESLRLSISRAYQVTDPHCFDDLLGAIDEAAEKLGKAHNEGPESN